MQAAREIDPEMQRELQYAVRHLESRDLIRKDNFGHDFPIRSLETKQGRVVIINELAYSVGRHVLPKDFLLAYVRDTLGREWYDGELSLPEGERNPILEWHVHLSEVERSTVCSSGPHILPAVGALYCFLGLAYSLMRLQDHAGIQHRMIHRLKTSSEFQGVYYELIVMGCLMRAGFKLRLEDESNLESKHVELFATSQLTGEEFAVEAKCRAFSGILGKNDKNGTNNPRSDPTKNLTKHIRYALEKPDNDRRRMLFVDVNAECEGDYPPQWDKQARRRLVDMERDYSGDREVYLFVTNFAFHRSPTKIPPRTYTLAWGLGSCDFDPTHRGTPRQWFSHQLKHYDAFRVVQSICSFPRIPPSFGDKLFSEIILGRERLLIGKFYTFSSPSGPIHGRLFGIGLRKNNPKIIDLAIETYPRPPKPIFLTYELNDLELDDMIRYGGAYFGDHRMIFGSNPYDMYQRLHDMNSGGDRDTLEEIARNRLQMAEAEIVALEDENLLHEVCERMLTDAVSLNVR